LRSSTLRDAPPPHCPPPLPSSPPYPLAPDPFLPPPKTPHLRPLHRRPPRTTAQKRPTREHKMSIKPEHTCSNTPHAVHTTCVRGRGWPPIPTSS
jgi:hypothetical protein